MAAILRFYNFWNLPFMHDEFSAIFRTYYDSFSDLIEIGVKQNDSHPAGVQVFIYYWIKVFGINEESLKFPFILLGISSVYVVYLIGKKWFNGVAALLSALVFAVIQLSIFYSQLARPYSPGLFFVLLSTLFWTKLVFDKQVKITTIVTYILAASCASYIHAFSLFFIFIQGISGLLFLKQKKLRNYILINILVFTLYLPHLSIFLAQIGRGDIGGWLGEPSAFFLLEFVNYVFHYSWIFIALILGVIIILPFISSNKNEGINKFRYLGLGWFLVTYLVAHIYSIYRSPIIQYSTLLFVFPFLLLFAFSFIGEIKLKLKVILFVLIAIVGTTSLIVNRQHYNIMYTQGFDGICDEMVNDNKYFVQKNTVVILQSPEHRMFDYYLNKNKLEPNYFKLSNANSISEVVDFLNTKDEDVLMFGWADYANLEYLEFFKHRYKYILKEKQFFNSEYYLFSNTLRSEYSKSQQEFVGTYDFKKQNINYKATKAGYSKPLILHLDSLNLTKQDVLNIRANVKFSNSEKDALLVFDLKDENEDVESWSASAFKKFYLNEDSSGYYVYHSKRVMSINPISKGSILKVYIWNRDASLVEVSDIEFYITKINPIETGLYSDIN